MPKEKVDLPWEEFLAVTNVRLGRIDKVTVEILRRVLSALGVPGRAQGKKKADMLLALEEAVSGAKKADRGKKEEVVFSMLEKLLAAYGKCSKMSPEAFVQVVLKDPNYLDSLMAEAKEETEMETLLEEKESRAEKFMRENAARLEQLRMEKVEKKEESRRVRCGCAGEIEKRIRLQNLGRELAQIEKEMAERNDFTTIYQNYQEGRM